VTLLALRALNRATLERQMLLSRRKLPAVEAIEHLVGMQAQAPKPTPYVGSVGRGWKGFHPDELSRLILDRRAVRIALMRNTVHLVTARDCLTLRPLVQPVFGRGLYANRAHRSGIEGVDIEALVAAGRALLEERPRTAKELGELLRERWPDRDPRRSRPRDPPPGAAGPGSAPRHLGKERRAAHTTAEAWLGRPLDPDPSLDEMVVRYLGAFGPATVKDVQTWSGLTRLGEVTDRLRPRLRIFRDEHGNELFDLPDARGPTPTRRPRHASSRVRQPDPIPRRSHPRHRQRPPKAIASKNGMVPATVLVDGFVRGTWKTERTRGRRRS
jgi:hypothetical protein